MVPVKVFLPEEVKPNDVTDLGGLNLEFDATESLFYVYKNDLVLEPGATRIYEVEVNDIWVIPQSDMDNIRDRLDTLLPVFANTQYATRMQDLQRTTENLFQEIVVNQADDTLTRSQHIGVYRTNKKGLDALKKELQEMEQILEAKSGPLTPDIFDKSKFKTRIPTKTATWLIIFSLIIFLILLSFVFFFTWYRQSRVTHEVISEARRSSFGEEEAKSPDADAKN